MGQKLLIALNLCDLFLCLLSTAATPMFNVVLDDKNKTTSLIYQIEVGEINETDVIRAMKSYGIFAVVWQSVIYIPYQFLVLVSCFTTVLLSTTRMIALVKPLYIMRQKIVWTAFATSLTFLFCTQIPKWFTFINLYEIYNTDEIISKVIHNPDEAQPYFINGSIMMSMYIQMAEFLLVGMMVVVVAVNSVLTVRALNSPTVQVEGSDGQPDNSNNRRATVMILLLSLVFVIVNGIWLTSLVVIYVYLFGEQLQLDGTALIMEVNEGSDEKRFLVTFITLVMMPANSIANPLICIARNKALNDYVKMSLSSFVKVISRVIQELGSVALSSRNFN